MIKELSLKKYGKFKDKRFVFGPVTIFLGKNESGKSTIFDSIFEYICNPKKTTVYGKRLQDRYGNSRSVKLNFEDNPIEIDPDEFINLYAVHSGNIELEFNDKKDWMQKVKASLFTGGVDPAKLSDILFKKASTKKTIKLQRDIEDTGRKVEKLEDELIDLKNQRKETIDKEKTTIKDKAEVASLEEKLKVKKNELLEIKTDIEQQEKIKKRKGLADTIDLINKIKTVEMELQKLSVFEKDETNEISVSENQLADFKSNLKTNEEVLKNISGQIDDNEKKLQDNENKLKTLKLLDDFAKKYRDKIDSSAPLRKITDKKTYKGSKLITGITLIVLSAGPYVFMSHLPYWFIISGVFLLFGLFLMITSRTTIQIEEPYEIEKYVQKIQGDWNNEKAGRILASKTIDGIKTELIQISAELQSEMRRNIELIESLNKLKGKQDEIKNNKNSLETNIVNEEKEKSNWLQERGVSSKDEYIQERTNYVNKKKEASELDRRLKDREKELDVPNIFELEKVCTREIMILDEGITQKTLSEPEENLLKNKQNNLNKEIENLNETIKQKTESVATDIGGLHFELNSIINNISNTDNDLVKSRQTLEGFKVSQQGACLAAEIFGEIACDSQVVMDKMSDDISRYLKVLVPTSDVITMDKLSLGSVMVSDIGGQKREIEHLSKGTRDAFMLSARLSLVVKTHREEEKGLLIFDEPFHTLDKEREENAIKLLHKFYNDYGWQIIVFTKDEILANEIKKSFPDGVLHNLS